MNIPVRTACEIPLYDSAALDDAGSFGMISILLKNMMNGGLKKISEYSINSGVIASSHGRVGYFTGRGERKC